MFFNSTFLYSLITKKKIHRYPNIVYFILLIWYSPMLFIKNNENLTEITETTYDKEDQMQEYIYENPQLLPIEELTGNKKLLVLIRELSTNYGRLDWLGIDEAGNVYIIETKLLRNPDRRNIIAQLLDYGVALRTEYKDPQDLLNYLSNKGVDTKQFIIDTFESSEEMADIIIENFKNNLKQWTYQFVAVTDAVEKRILEQIQFINQSSRFSFYLVDLRYYRHNDSEFIIPKGYGGEVIKNTNTWNLTMRMSELPEFLDAIENNLWLEARIQYEKLAQVLQSKGFFLEIRVRKVITFAILKDKDDFQLFSIQSDTGQIWVNTNSKKVRFETNHVRDQLKRSLCTTPKII